MWDGVANPVGPPEPPGDEGGGPACSSTTRATRRRPWGWPRSRARPIPTRRAKNPRAGGGGPRGRRRLARPVTLAEIKALAAFAESPLVRQGRLSVVPLDRRAVEGPRGPSRELSERVVVLSTVAKAEDAERIAARPRRAGPRRLRQRRAGGGVGLPLEGRRAARRRAAAGHQDAQRAPPGPEGGAHGAPPLRRARGPGPSRLRRPGALPGLAGRFGRTRAARRRHPQGGQPKTPSRIVSRSSGMEPPGRASA